MAVDESAEDWGVPPVALCTVCGRGDCAGCSRAPLGALEAASVLAWEQSSAGWWTRLWQTATAASDQPEHTFSQLPFGPVGSAVVFACVVECLALGSLALVAVVGLAVLAPAVLITLVHSPLWLSLVGGAMLGLVSVMVGLHALWGWSLEAATLSSSQRVVNRRAQGLRFGLYACGWDLLTSPIGLLHGLVVRGPLGAWGPLVSAARAPRKALEGYLGGCRQLDATDRRQAVRRSMLVVAVSLALLIALAVAGVVLAALHFGY